MRHRNQSPPSGRFLFFYLTRDAPDALKATAPRHVEYWRALQLPECIGGPFADKSGGLITFEAGSEEEADRLVANDPFLREGLLERHWVKALDA